MQTDFDGTTSHSQIVAVRLEEESSIIVYPTLVNDYITIQSNQGVDINFSLFSADGRLVKNEEFKSSSNGIQEFRFLRGAIAAGIYFARTTDTKGNSLTQKLIFK